MFYKQNIHLNNLKKDLKKYENLIKKFNVKLINLSSKFENNRKIIEFLINFHFFNFIFLILY